MKILGHKAQDFGAKKVKICEILVGFLSENPGKFCAKIQGVWAKNHWGEKKGEFGFGSEGKNGYFCRKVLGLGEKGGILGLKMVIKEENVDFFPQKIVWVCRKIRIFAGKCAGLPENAAFRAGKMRFF